MSMPQTFTHIVQFYTNGNELVAEETLEYESAAWEDCMQEAEHWAEAHLEDFGADYYEIS